MPGLIREAHCITRLGMSLWIEKSVCHRGDNVCYLSKERRSTEFHVDFIEKSFNTSFNNDKKPLTENVTCNICFTTLPSTDEWWNDVGVFSTQNLLTVWIDFTNGTNGKMKNTIEMPSHAKFNRKISVSPKRKLKHKDDKGKEEKKNINTHTYTFSYMSRYFSMERFHRGLRVRVREEKKKLFNLRKNYVCLWACNEMECGARLKAWVIAVLWKTTPKLHNRMMAKQCMIVPTL